VLCPLSLRASCRSALRSVSEFQTGANSNYTGLQTEVNEKIGGLLVRANYTLSHCLDEVSNGGLLSFSSLGILAPLPGELRREYSNCDYDVRHNVSAFGIYQIPFTFPVPRPAHNFAGWSFSETAFLHSGLPFTVLSQPYTASGNGIFQSSGPQFARRIAGVPVYRKTAYAGVTVDGTRQWLNPEAFESVVDPATGACSGGDSPTNCQFGNAGETRCAGPTLLTLTCTSPGRFDCAEGLSLRFDAQLFNAFNHPNFALPANAEAGVPGETCRRDSELLKAQSRRPRAFGRRIGGDSSPRMIAFQARFEF